MKDTVHFFSRNIFGLGVFLWLDFESWLELFIVYISGLGEKRYIAQLSIFSIEIIKAKKDRWIKTRKTVGEKAYNISTRNRKYDNDNLVVWSWSIKNGVEKRL